jgi:hypothetical protein
MNREEIENIRETFHIPQVIGDEKFDMEYCTRNLGGHNIVPDEIIGNSLALEVLFQKTCVENPGEYTICENVFEGQLQNTCIRLFADGYYGACCVMARSLAEYMLQEDCLKYFQNSKKESEVKILKKIKKDGKNVDYKKMIDALGERLSGQAKKSLEVLNNNGNAVVHHLYNDLTDKTMTEIPGGTPFMRFDGRKGTFYPAENDNRAYLELSRKWAERQKAIESMEALYRLLFLMRSK